ncbi:uncharacterized protein LOC119278330 isoform X1 [Triticum dicoccoides]|uniref:uncharacterized protein LOC119278330 isoform X1 n=1 Tax=Triticum dicoccoides TaxID=85692 RepID=UPI00189026C9|nr:uncharacterized protein LOC119278330 isoform X1 [Triticum dicoccoides]
MHLLFTLEKLGWLIGRLSKRTEINMMYSLLLDGLDTLGIAVSRKAPASLSPWGDSGGDPRSGQSGRSLPSPPPAAFVGQSPCGERRRAMFFRRPVAVRARGLAAAGVRPVALPRGDGRRGCRRCVGADLAGRGWIWRGGGWARRPVEVAGGRGVACGLLVGDGMLGRRPQDVAVSTCSSPVEVVRRQPMRWRIRGPSARIWCEADRRPVAAVRQRRTGSGPWGWRGGAWGQGSDGAALRAGRPQVASAAAGGGLHGGVLLCGWPRSATPLWREMGCSGFCSRWWLAAVCCSACLVMWLGR